jgi:hypothetical protein
MMRKVIFYTNLRKKTRTLIKHMIKLMEKSKLE